MTGEAEGPAVSVRLATAADAEALAEMGATTFYDTYADFNTKENMDAFLEAHFSPEKQAAEIASPSTAILVAEVDGAGAGYAKLEEGPAHASVTGEGPIEIARFYVRREWHGRRVADALMRGCLDEARRRGSGTVWLGVWERNPRARAFYARWGFVDVGEHVFLLGSDAQTDRVLVREI